MTGALFWGLVALGLGTLIAPLMGQKGLNWRWLFRRRAFGSARWARPKDFRKHEMDKPGGLFLGQWRAFGGLLRRDLYHNTEGHLLTIAGTGGGKSSGLVVPALCDLVQGSVIVTDPSGELAAMTGRRRAEIGPVVYLNPFGSVFAADTGLSMPDDGFNPFSVLDPNDPNFVSEVSALSRFLMVTDRRDSGSYWNDEGAEVLALLIASILLFDPPDLHNLPFLFEVIHDSAKRIQMRFERIEDAGHPALSPKAAKYADIIAKAPPQWAGIGSKASLAVKRYAPSTPLGEHVKRNGLDLRRLKRENLTVFLLVPPSMLNEAAPWLNMLLGLFGSAIGKPGPRRPVTLLIDEAPSLGFLPDLQSQLQQFRKVGLRAWLFTQTYASMAAPDLYGEAGMKNLMGLATVKQFFAVEEPEMQRYVSDLCGQRSVANTASSGGIGDVGQPLIRPDEVRGLKPWSQIIVRGGMQHAIRAKLIPYFRRDRWRKIVDPNPYRT
ncbi:type IV secretory system conjugative DNA transfer family protein [Jiella mangrovi]|uniref:Type IV secretory system conjugative DNA transfer family protein n=1 Tax=Jiella mangrovi TaxID=2821407 RepID=A0ABS4BNI4_9HYPH|nr:type IV secretory system conjugative DNA transfer family protein [Jiella mangrovi]MBP0618308.1 type IV secretory system conjugative DNA transfer family protein [Jiella mangrovi]